MPKYVTEREIPDVGGSAAGASDIRAIIVPTTAEEQ
jgi:hypothetical protein